MIAVIDPVEPARLQSELAPHAKLCGFRGLEIHTLAGDDYPQVMREIGRLRESGFRRVGAGRNLDCDLDPLDFGSDAYHQLLAWDPVNQEIVAVYRYQLGFRALAAGDRVLRTSQLFEYSQEFNHSIKPCSIELGRSVVNEQARRRALGLFALWTGLHALLGLHDGIRYFFGNVSLYDSMDATARSLAVAFLETHYQPPQTMLKARNGLQFTPRADHLAEVEKIDAATPDERIRALRDLLKPYGEKVPPILQSYMGLGRDIWFGQTAHDHDFGDALETGVIVPIETTRDSGAIERFQPKTNEGANHDK